MGRLGGRNPLAGSEIGQHRGLRHTARGDLHQAVTTAVAGADPLADDGRDPGQQLVRMPARVPDQQLRGRLGQQLLDRRHQRVLGFRPVVAVVRLLPVAVGALDRELHFGNLGPDRLCHLQRYRRIDHPGPDRLPPYDVVQNSAVGNNRDTVLADQIGQVVQPARWPGGDHYENTSGVLCREHRRSRACRDGSVGAY
jgi:hypothetical protein